MHKFSKVQQKLFKDDDDNQVVQSVEDALQEKFTAAESIEVLELDEEGKYVVCENKESYQGSGKLVNMLQLDLPHNSSATLSVEDIDDDQPAEGRVILNVVLVHE